MNDIADIAKARTAISQAIAVGAPAYNRGDVRGCAEVYQETARGMIDSRLDIPASLRDRLKSEVDDGITDTTDYNDKAWALRRVFDSILEYQPPIVPRDSSLATELTMEPFTPAQLGEARNVMDSVMGGVSQGGWIPDAKTFFGETSLRNNGGFASVRWRFPNAQNWSYAKGIYIRGLKHTDPQTHTFRIILKDAMCERVRLANFKAIFSNPENSAEGPLLIPFDAFDKMEQMGRPMQGSPAFNPSTVTEIGIMAIKPSVVGAFQLEFDDWGLYM